MVKTKRGLAIVNRSFQPGNHALFDALLALTRQIACEHPVYIIAELDKAKSNRLAVACCDLDVHFVTCPPHSDSSSGLIKRAWDTTVFMVWTLFSLTRCRPEKVYVSTNPPVLVPFIVFLYCRVARCKYFYHLQDIHPEAAATIVHVHALPFRLFRWIDSVAMRHAEALITLTDEMEQYILKRSKTKVPIYLLDNPASHVPSHMNTNRDKGIVFCGNAGRLQRIPLLIDAIRCYLDQGGTLRFGFAGAGLYAPEITELADQYDNVTYHGSVSAAKASELMNQNQWALMPIEDGVTRYAFPSKSSSYALAGCSILAICGHTTSVARWIERHGLGYVIRPKKADIIEIFKKIESGAISIAGLDRDRVDLEERLTIPYFVRTLRLIMKIDLASDFGDAHRCVKFP